MDKRSSRPKKNGRDFAATAFRVVQQAITEAEQNQTAPPVPLSAREDGKNPAAVELGRLGGKKGGPARAKALSATKRKEIARKAAQARWASRHMA